MNDEWLFADGFTFLTTNVFAYITDSFAFVGLGRIISADLSGELSDHLFIDAFHLDLGVIGNGNGETIGDGMKQRVRATEGQVEVLTLDGGTETHALDLKVFDEALGNAVDHVVDDRTGGAVESAQLARGLRGAGDSQFVVLVAQLDAGWKGEGQFAFGTLDGDNATIVLNGDFFWQCDRFNSYA